MHIVFSLFRQCVIEHMGNIIDMQPATGDKLDLQKGFGDVF